MDRFKKMILDGIERGNIKNISDCVAAAIGWFKMEESNSVPIEILEWIFKLFE